MCQNFVFSSLSNFQIIIEFRKSLTICNVMVMVTAYIWSNRWIFYQGVTMSFLCMYTNFLRFTNTYSCFPGGYSLDEYIIHLSEKILPWNCFFSVREWPLLTGSLCVREETPVGYGYKWGSIWICGHFSTPKIGLRTKNNFFHVWKYFAFIRDFLSQSETIKAWI